MQLDYLRIGANDTMLLAHENGISFVTSD